MRPPKPASSSYQRGATTTLTEAEGSPRWIWGQQIVCVQEFAGLYAICRAAVMVRGTYGSGDVAGMRLAESTLVNEGKGIGRVTFRWEHGGDGAPPEGQELPKPELSIEPQRSELALRKHLRYRILTDEDHADIKTTLETAVGSKDWVDAAERLEFDANAGLIAELRKKLLRGHTHFVIYTASVSLVTFHWTPPSGLTMGGSQEEPSQRYLHAPGRDLSTRGRPPGLQRHILDAHPDVAWRAGLGH